MIEALAFVLAVGIAAGLVPALALTGDVLEAVITAPLVTAVLATLAGVLAVVTRTEPHGWFAAAVVAASAGGGVVIRRTHGDPDTSSRWTTDRSRVVGRLIVAGALALPFVTMARPPADWDTQSIWYHHAKWFAVGGPAARDAFGLEHFSHADYPPLVPATSGVISALWESLADMFVHQAAVSVLGYCALVWLAWQIAAVGRGKRASMWFGLGVLASVVIVAEGGRWLTNGMADALWSATAAGAAVGLLIRPIVESKDRLHKIGAPCLLLLVAMLTKNEGTALGLAILVAFAARYRRVLPVWMFGAFAAVPLSWLVLSRLLGAQSYLTRDGNIGRALGEGFALVVRGRYAAGGLLGEVLPLVLVIVVVALGALTIVDHHQRRVLLGRLALLAVLAAVSLAAAWIVYVLGPFPIDGFIESSVDRTSLGATALLAVGVAIGVGGLVQKPSRPSLPEAEGRRPPGAGPRHLVQTAVVTPHEDVEAVRPT